ncbi:hypothetical protein JJQ72_03895 [Paenibacillus sp. F411]|uniref:Uncharacterized protein n=1 Tax=Paenibacillus algicola TaxID=2565926 RepID=A0A4P8XJZ5_9BACL|nr:MULTISPECIES: hypothetical protein [Paenibacillus]MBO2943124.1 hypothetical protein [Paenibacillus sp. F411]QCT02623.1 hypothetical protein E6C60_1908 [Paenibacillus algicola]
MANQDHNEQDSQETIQEQKNQFRSFVEGVSEGGSRGSNDAIEDKARIPDNQNRLVDKHNLRK